MSYSYLITPFVAWFVAGVLKFLVNSIRARNLSFDLIGYGGLPSNHTAIVVSSATLIGLREGVDAPAFGVAITLAFIVILDALSLRRKIGQQAFTINAMNKANFLEGEFPLLRERIGHTPLEIFAGFVVGVAVAFLVDYLPCILRIANCAIT